MSSGAPGAENGDNSTMDGGLVMSVDVTDYEFFDRLLVLGRSTPPVVVERRRGADRRAGQDRRQTDHSPVADRGSAAAPAGRPTGTGLGYTTAWQLSPGEAGS